MIEAHGLTKYYAQNPAIVDVSFHVKEGEIVAFLGPNGAGKSTTMRILTGYLPATFGTARVAGFDLAEESLAARRTIGYMPEAVPLYSDMRVTQYLTYCGRLEAMGKAQLDERMEFVLDRCGLDDHASAIIGTLSLGYRQRVGLAQAMLHDPPVLILDEPTVGLDPNQIIEVRNLIKSLAGDHTVMLSTHILPEAQMTCERVLIINQGEIVAEGSPQDLTAQIREAETLLITVRDDSETVARQIKDIPRVTGVRSAEQPASYYIDTQVGADLRAELSEFVVKKGWGLLELRAVEMSLEDVFRQLTTEEKGVA
jgi:ABC-2 type transport system ATP-binding protein